MSAELFNRIRISAAIWLTRPQSSLSALLLLAAPVAAPMESDTPDDQVLHTVGEVIIDPESTSSDFNLFDYFDINATVGLSFGSSVDRQFYALRIGGKYNVGGLSMAGNLLVSSLNADIDLELTVDGQKEKSRCANEPAYRLENAEDCADWLATADRINYRFEAGASLVDELYLTWVPLDAVSLTLGQNRLTLGQFAFISPIQLLLPINSEGQIGLSKVDSQIPQLLLDLSFYPIERLQLQFVNLFQTRVDIAQEEYFDRQYRDSYFDTDLDPLPGYEVALDSRERFASKDQSIFRILYRPDWGAVGLTSWRGPLHSSIIDYYRVGCDTVECAPAGMQCGPTTCSVFEDFRLEAGPDLPDAEALSFEIAVHSGNWTLIGEYVRVQTQNDINIHSEIIPGIKACPIGKCESAFQLHNFLNDLVRMNAGHTWFDVTYHLAAVGADGRNDAGTWFYNLELLALSADLGEAQTLISHLGSRIDIFDPTWTQDTLANYSDLVFPTFHIGNRHTAFGRQANWGLALGYFLQFGGLLSYYNFELTENFSLQFGLEVLERQAEGDAAREDRANYSLIESHSIGLSVAARLHL